MEQEAIETHIRGAHKIDAPAIAALVREQLGYAHIEDKELQSRLSLMLAHSDYRVLVATAAEVAVGFIGVQKGIAFEMEEPYGRIIALAVAPDFAGRGIGTALVQAAEAWCTQQGCGGMAVSSGLQRERAHRFYEKCGYLKKSHAFKKVLS